MDHYSMDFWSSSLKDSSVCQFSKRSESELGIYFNIPSAARFAAKHPIYNNTGFPQERE
jgi:hypothetical protein